MALDDKTIKLLAEKHGDGIDIFTGSGTKDVPEREYSIHIFREKWVDNEPHKYDRFKIVAVDSVTEKVVGSYVSLALAPETAEITMNKVLKDNPELASDRIVMEGDISVCGGSNEYNATLYSHQLLESKDKDYRRQGIGSHLLKLGFSELKSGNYSGLRHMIRTSRPLIKKIIADEQEYTLFDNYPDQLHEFVMFKDF